MTDQKQEGIYKWKSGHSGLSFDPTKYWASGQPTGGENVDCLCVKKSEMYDCYCSGYDIYGACQKRKNKKSKFIHIIDIKLVK